MITIGFIAASIAAGISLVFLTRMVTPPEAAQISDAGFGGWIIGATILFSSLAGYVAFFPAIVIILYSEFTARRGWLFYALAGGAIAAVVPLALTVFQGSGEPSETPFLAMGIATGMIGGLTYWIVAGRNAGNWLPNQG